MARAPLLLALVGLCCSLAAAQQTYSSLQPYTYTVDLSYNIGGVLYENPIPCTNANSQTSDCLPQVSVPDKDSVIINYSGPETPGNTISLMFCYSNYSAVDRAWRKASPTISKDKQCNVAKPFAKGLPTGTGSYTWTPGQASAPSTYFIQLLEVVPNTDPTQYSAAGRSTGFFQIIPIDSRPGWLMAMTGVFCTIGPLTLAGFFTYERRYKKA